MKTLLVSALLLSLATQELCAQTIPSATAPRSVPHYVEKHSQFDAMSPHPASASTIYDADSALSSYGKKSRYLQPPVYTGSKNNRTKTARPHVRQPASAATAAGAYSNSPWNADQTYASPQTSDPYSARPQ
ncbi:hypothetical protein [Paraburkholderia rhynchosiae]|uniref:hypothetical protein n=1 Tax=Paraburkholderia rhynchosiae TaxID=487049 RepID=UPI0011AFA117|nr:hypothetical protein [Paraburkholderia rhynchosiae]